MKNKRKTTLKSLPITAVIMAGGAGTRLHPKTLTIPKALLPINNKPLIELIILKLRKARVRDVYISVHYMAKKITDYFEKKNISGINIHYLHEKTSRGTAGSLQFMKNSKRPLLVFNGDILTNLDIEKFYRYHKAKKADLTLATYKNTTQSPFGIVEAEGDRLRRVVEKPTRIDLINSGIYMIDPRLCHYIPSGKPYDMTSLVKKSVAARDRIFCYYFKDFWLDIGTPEGYGQVNEKGESV